VAVSPRLADFRWWQFVLLKLASRVRPEKAGRF